MQSIFLTQPDRNDDHGYDDNDTPTHTTIFKPGVNSTGRTERKLTCDDAVFLDH